jgi:hypothetical protein
MLEDLDESDKRVLQAVYAATGGDHWTRKRGWMSTAPHSEWEDVTINFTGGVSQLNLIDNNLCGIISLRYLLHLMKVA